MIGEIVYYKMEEAPQVFYPAIVTHERDPWFALTVFPEVAPVFNVSAQQGQNTPGHFQRKPPGREPRPEVPDDDLLILLTAPHQDPRALLPSKERLAAVRLVVAVEPDGSHTIVKSDGVEPRVCVKRGEKRKQAIDYAHSFLERVGLGDDIETRLTDWFEAAMNGEAP